MPRGSNIGLVVNMPTSTLNQKIVVSIKMHTGGELQTPLEKEDDITIFN